MDQLDETNSKTPTEQTLSQKPATPAKRQLTRNEKLRDFAIGFIGWWVVNGLLWTIADKTAFRDDFGSVVLFCAVPINIVSLIFLAFLRRWVALGVLATYVVNFAMALILGTITNGYCWIPFTTPMKPFIL
ncbi:MAG: hypothetical protein A2W35_12060 [Chloroflexi bacterium RBG_16_57_11]|nr:MAG: hypothetical protein A2W35_12060 [Chloroflexi bacterium RBG_16_57_11]